jgi:hypothetical protein
MMARSIGSIIWVLMTSGTKGFTKLYFSLRSSKGIVKKGARSFYSSLLSAGIPEDAARIITSAYSKPGIEMLKIRNIMKMVSGLTGE